MGGSIFSLSQLPDSESGDIIKKGNDARGEEKGRLFREGVQEEGAWSMISGMRGVWGQVYTGGQ